MSDVRFGPFEGSTGERLYVVRRGERVEAPFVEVAAGRGAAMLRAWLSDPVSRRSLVEVHAALFGRLALAGWDPAEGVRRIEEDLRGAFERGALSVWRLAEVGTPVLQDRPEPSSRPRPEPGKKRSWIEIELLDDDGRRVATELVVTLPDGSKIRPSFGGFLRIDDIDPGLCDIEFPKIDGREWEKAGR